MGAVRTVSTKMKAKYSEMAWLGIGYDTDEKGHWVVDKVYDRSPAQKAGFEKGDVLLAVNDVKYSKDNKKELKAAYAKFEPGTETTYWVKRDGEKVKLEATLGSVPKDVQRTVDRRAHGAQPSRIPDGLEIASFDRGRADFGPPATFGMPTASYM